MIYKSDDKFDNLIMMINFMIYMIKKGVINLIENCDISECRKMVKNVQKWPNQKRL